jgi:putative ABC transport system ATP-binding protein
VDTQATHRPLDAPETTPSAVELHGVTRVYGTRTAAVRALDNVDIGFPAASWTAVMGPSGSGKSTLLHCAAGLERVTSGRVRVAGQDITDASDAELTRLRRTVLGFVFQSFNLIGSLTAEQNVAMPLRLAGQRPPRKVVREVLASVGLADRARHRPGELSGGQQQRVAIGRALAVKPLLLLADEPTGNLDEATADEVLALTRDLVTRTGCGFLMVTHSARLAATLDRQLNLHAGLIA